MEIKSVINREWAKIFVNLFWFLPTYGLTEQSGETWRAPPPILMPLLYKTLQNSLTKKCVSLAGPPTKYELYEWLKQRWLASKPWPRESIYTSSYPRPPVCVMSRESMPFWSLPITFILSNICETHHSIISSAINTWKFTGLLDLPDNKKP